MVPGSQERIGQSGKDAGSGVVDLRGLAMHWSPGTNNVGTIRRSNALVSQTDSQDRNAGADASHRLGRDPCLCRRAGTRRNDDVGGVQRRDLFYSDRVVPADQRLLTQLFDVAGKIVDKRVVVIDEE